ncbi:MAG: energy-coupling factor ABC transporter permease [Spirochaetaceae bacterium]|jgi:ABC-type Co2+ transport system permease subunit|nr:energy-coupling factor ABC transporter permease [Spirochaetaceae bacterium]
MHISEGVLSPAVLAAGWALAAGGLAAGLKKTAPEDLPRCALVSAVLFLSALVHIPLGPSSIHLTLLGLAGILLGWSAVPALFIALLLQGLLFQFGGLLSLGVNTAIMGSAALSAHGLWKIYGRIAAKRPTDCTDAGRGAPRANPIPDPNPYGGGDRAIRGSAIASFPPQDKHEPSPQLGAMRPEQTPSMMKHPAGAAGTLRAPTIPCAKSFPAAFIAFCAGFLAIIVGSVLVCAALTLSDMNLKTIAALIFTANLPLALLEGIITMFIVIFLNAYR